MNAVEMRNEMYHFGNKISEEIKRFETKTGLAVRGIDVEREETLDLSPSRLLAIRLDVRLT